MNKKSIITLLPLSIGVVALVGCRNSNVVFTEKDVNLYVLKSTVKFTQKLYFSNDYQGIPFIDLKDGVSLLHNIYTLQDVKSVVTGNVNNESFTFNKNNNSYVTFDLKNNKVTSPNLNLFKQSIFTKGSLDMRGVNDNFYNEKGEKEEGVRFATVKNDLSWYETVAIPTSIELNNYHINTYFQDGKYLVPFTTFYNITGPSSIACIYNGENLFITSQYLDTTTKDSEGKTIKDIFYSFTKQERSDALKNYNYNELVRDLDYVYGLKSEHGISSFEKFMTDNGLKNLLLSSRYDEDKAYALLQQVYIADSHSGYTIQNAYGGEDLEEKQAIAKEIAPNPAYIQRYYKSLVTKLNRMQYQNIDTTGNVIKPYQKTGNTVIITFDHFLMNDNTDFYYTDEFKNNKEKYIANDTVALVSYAHDLITKDDTIERVVIDISGNGGGAADAAIFILGWLESSYMQIEDPINNYRGSYTYLSDVNFDKKVDKEDLLSTVFKGKVYCLTSQSSFSCGNYVPAMLKQSEKVKLVGSRSGGGACSVHVTATADGTGISFSSNNKLCQVINGSYYSIDTGIEPDYPLTDYKTLYGGTEKTEGTETVDTGDRKNIVDYLAKLEA